MNIFGIQQYLMRSSYSKLLDENHHKNPNKADK